MTPNPDFFLSFVREKPNGRLYNWRSKLEDHKAFLANLSPKKLDGPDTLVSIKQAANELATSTRTIKRRIKEAQEAADISADRAA